MIAHHEKEDRGVSKVDEVQRLLRELIAERELAVRISQEQKDRGAERDHRHAANRYWNALDSVSRA